jgi:hypothetical protein
MNPYHACTESEVLWTDDAETKPQSPVSDIVAEKTEDQPEK